MPLEFHCFIYKFQHEDPSLVRAERGKQSKDMKCYMLINNHQTQMVIGWLTKKQL